MDDNEITPIDILSKWITFKFQVWSLFQKETWKGFPKACIRGLAIASSFIILAALLGAL